MQSYFLAPHVYPCVTEDHVVLLDLARDKYVGVAPEQMGSLAAQVKGWPLHGADGADDVRLPNTSAEAVLAKLVATGMLTTDASVGKEARPLKMPDASMTLVEAQLEGRPALQFVDVIRFLIASAVTALMLRFLPIRAVMSGVMRRKANAVARAGRLDAAGRFDGAQLFDAEVARRATAAFIRLRPLVFGAQDRCLYDSLSLARFLSYYRQFPSCVIGVQTGPFGAHCWVQEGNVVLNDEPEYVRRFTPIFAV
jgi:transglutaminase superfamily protein